MGIKRLPSAVVSSLRTDVTVTTAAQCVTELVLNSIDAGATSIAIRVDLKNYKIQVVDNGVGLSSSDLSLVGSRYMTSKCQSLQDLQSNLSHFGFRGEALSSISEVCGTMTIASRYRGSDETFCKVFTRGTAHTVSKSRQPRASCGTTISVADFLFNRPVRRARIKPALDFEEIKTHIESIALINPTVSFSLRNDENGEVILQTQRTSDTPSAFGTLFGVSIACNLVPVEESMGPFKVKGYISNKAHPLKNFQFIYINKRLLLKTKIHKLVNSLLSRSAILKSNNVPYNPISKEINHSVFLAFSPPKRDKHAVFVLNITCPLSEYDITLDPKKTLVEFCDWDGLLNCFENLLRKFIEREADDSSVKGNVFDSEPPRKIKSVMDEINLLAREDAIGANMSETSEESITVKNLPRAIHGLPANRCPVNLSPVPSTECFPSTSSSAIFSCSTEVKVTRDFLPPYPDSVLTEKPYPPLSSGPPAQCKEKIPSMKVTSGWTDTECSGKSRYSVESLKKSIFKKPESYFGTKPSKGFIPEPIYFQENSAKATCGLLEANSKINKEPAPSPLNALASIKEIRRKKLLRNLDKFSFNATCEKPVLLKAEVPAPGVEEVAAQSQFKADNYLQKSNEVHTAPSQKFPQKNLKESRAVQTTFSTINFDFTEHTEKGTSVIPIGGSSAASNLYSDKKNVSVSTNSCIPNRSFSSDKDTVSNCDKVIEQREVNVENPSENSGNLNLKCACFQEQNFFKSFEVPHKKKVTENTFLNFLSAEEMIDTRNITKENIAMSDFDEVLGNTLQKSGQDFMDIFTDSTGRNVQPSEVNNFKFRCKDTSIGSGADLPDSKITPSTIDTFGQFGLKISDSVSFDLDAINCSGTYSTNLGQQMQPKKIVDYDSSPCSSQETPYSVENTVESDATSPSILKRKLENGEKILQKKFCSSPDTHIVKESSASQNDKSVEMLHLGQNDYAQEEEGKRVESSCDACPIPDAILSNFETTESLKETNYSQHINTFDEKMDEVEMCQESIADHHSTEDCPETETNQGKNMETIGFDVSQDTSSSETSNEQEWIKQLDHDGKSFYLHKKSGLTTYQMPKEERQGAFKIGDRFPFLPKGMSPILYDKATKEPSNSPSITSFRMEEDLSAVKWSSDDKKANFWPLVDQLLSAADSFSTKIHSESQVSNATAPELSQTDIKVYNVMFPYSFSKDLFNNLRVLGQLDNKFIVTIATIDTNKDVIVLFDQHAVHERIRVENLTLEYKEDGCKAKWKSAPVDPALPLPLSSIEVRILESYQEKMENLGFHFSVMDSTTISVLRVPTCLLFRENREVNGRGVSVLRQHLESLIREQVDSLLNTRGVGTDHPTIIRNVISSEACRGAVKFGHPLTVADCQAFLHNLSKCNLPFQCAHGRPALMPVVDLSMLKQKPQPMKPNLKKLQKQFLHSE